MEVAWWAWPELRSSPPGCPHPPLHVLSGEGDVPVCPPSPIVVGFFCIFFNKETIVGGPESVSGGGWARGTAVGWGRGLVGWDRK